VQTLREGPLGQARVRIGERRGANIGKVAGRRLTCSGRPATDSRSRRTLNRLGDAHQAASQPVAARGAWQHALAFLDELSHPNADRVRSKLHGLNR
jgi:hypothetical protein